MLLSYLIAFWTRVVMSVVSVGVSLSFEAFMHLHMEVNRRFLPEHRFNILSVRLNLSLPGPHLALPLEHRPHARPRLGHLEVPRVGRVGLFNFDLRVGLVHDVE